VLPFDHRARARISYRTDGAGEPVEAETAIGAMSRSYARPRESASRQPDLPARWISCAAAIDTPKTIFFARKRRLLQEVQERLAAARAASPDAVQRIATEQASRI